MTHANQGAVASQVESLQRQFAQAPGLPFADLLPAPFLTRLLQEQDVVFNNRIDTPSVTLAMLLSQCHDADPSQRQAVVVSSPLGRRIAPAFREKHFANGRAARQDAGDGAQRKLGASVGL